MNENELEELRYDVAHYLLSKMSKGFQFQYANAPCGTDKKQVERLIKEFETK